MSIEKTRVVKYADTRPWKRVGRASDYIRHFKRLPGQRVILCCRVSARTQRHNGNLHEQERSLRLVVDNCDSHVVEVIHEVGPGWDHLWLIHAAQRAQKLGAILLAETTDRFIRPREYHSRKHPHAQPSAVDLRSLGEAVTGASLVTVIPPESSLAEARRYHTKRGQAAKGRSGGRPPQKRPDYKKARREQPQLKRPGYKKARREQLQPKVVRLHELGISLGGISQLTRLPRSTVQEWISRPEEKRGVRFFCPR